MNAKYRPMVAGFFVAGLIGWAFLPETPEAHSQKPNEPREQYWINSISGGKGCSQVIRIEPIDNLPFSHPDHDKDPRYVFCAEGTYWVNGTHIFNFGIRPAYCYKNEPAGCWPMYCRGTGTFNAEERERCRNFPEVAKAPITRRG
jgi:hypothetical protein